jgi:OFA family oxalate/formate antiporter-like MFS transporter
MSQNVSPSKGWIVTLAGTGINLALGVLYAWSVIKKALVTQWNWSNTDASLPYTVAAAAFAVTMVFAGRLQDKIGPRWVATIGGALTGIGLIIASFSQSVSVMILAFGIFAGTGFGLGYAAATPPALKWFHPSKKGLITGIVVSGFGLAAVYISPLTTWLLTDFGISKTFFFLGVAFLIGTTLLAQFLVNPPAGYQPPVPAAVAAAQAKAPAKSTRKDYEWKEMLQTSQFIKLWLMFAFTSSAGLMIIGHLATIAKTQAGWDKGFYLVALLAIFNAGGRIIAGVLSDKIGRTKTMIIVFSLQGVNMLLFGQYLTPATMAIGAAIAGFGYGALLSLFPSTVADYYGLKNLGANYGMVFTAWGVGGVFGPILAGWVADSTGTYQTAYLISAGLLALATILAFMTSPPKEAH